MMKPRSSRVLSDQAAALSRMKAENANGASNQQASVQARKRRSSINVYDQPSSLNSRLRQLETDMLRLDEDRTKLFDDTHSALAQYELKLSEIHAILKSRQDNVEKYVEDMKLLLQAKEDFERQTKLLNDKHDRIHEKFMHRETIISREIKLLKNKFEILEKNRQFRSMLQKSNQHMASADNTNDDLSSGLDGSCELSARKRSETATIQTGELDPYGGPDKGRLSSAGADLSRRGAAKSVRIRMSKLGGLSSLLASIIGPKRHRKAGSRVRRKSNKISSIAETFAAGQAGAGLSGGGGGGGGGEQAPAGQTAEAPSFHLDSQEPPAILEALETKIDGEATLDEHQRTQQQQSMNKVSGFLRRLFGG